LIGAKHGEIKENVDVAARFPYLRPAAPVLTQDRIRFGREP